jgi:hypothetical protein
VNPRALLGHAGSGFLTEAAAPCKPRRPSDTRGMPICASCGQDNPDIAKFCLACAALLAPPASTIEERKLATVLLTDIVGSTAKAEQMHPEDVRARLGPYYVRLRTELEHFGDTVEKFIGDAVVAPWSFISGLSGAGCWQLSFREARMNNFLRSYI